ncbi:MAG: thiamine diphosphokinase [Clostridiales bacterium]|nr:thiamine diphosphokinase [Clostridiales bacterium]MBR6484655.1 thiamine diphosphokinase [Clostridiales bacterium]
MRTAVITGGPGIDPAPAACICGGCDKVFCADSGVDLAVRAGIKIDKVFGDMDSISPEGRQFISDNNIPCEIYPVDKDYTDTEIALSKVPEDDEIVLVCSLGGRPDHLLAIINLCLRLRREGREITATDGISDIFFLSGKDYISVEGVIDPVGLAVSLINPNPDTTAKNVTAKGLSYDVENAEIPFGYGHFNSNSIKEGNDSFSVSSEEGELIVVVTLKGQ